jgi:hypothetical protein
MLKNARRVVIPLVVTGVSATSLAVGSVVRAAQAPWSAPAPIANLGQSSNVPTPGAVFAPAVGFDRFGRGLLVARGGGVSVSPLPIASVFMLAAPLGTDDLPGSVARVTPDSYQMLGDGFGFYGTDRMVAVGVRNGPGTAARAWLATGAVGAPLARPQLLPGIGKALRVSVAADRRGDIAVLAQTCRSLFPCTHAAVYLFGLRAGQRVGRAMLLAANANSFPPALAMNDRGEVLAAWSQDTKPGNSVLYARLRSPSGRPRARQALGPAGQQGFVSAALGPRGEAIVAWATEIVSECQPYGPATFRAATAKAGHDFGHAKLLERWTFQRCGGELSAPGVQAAIDTTGRGLIAWVGRARGRFAIRYAHASAGHVGAVQTGSAPDADTSLDRLAFGPHDEALLLWTRNQRGYDPSGPEALLAAAEPSGGLGFGPPELVTDQATPYGADAAFDPLSGRAIAVWSNDNRSASYAVRQPVTP